MDVRSYRDANIDSDHRLFTTHLRAQISNVEQVIGIRFNKYSVSKLTSTEVTEQYRQQIEEKLNHVTLIEQDNGENCGRDEKQSLILIAEELLGTMEPANKGT